MTNQVSDRIVPYADYHVHTTFSDGADAPNEMVEEAIRRGMKAIGFSDHSPTPFDLSYCMRPDQTEAYRTEIAGLRAKYADKIRILCGIEQDFYSNEETAGYDYVIGSVHYLKIDGEYIPVDETPDILLSAARRYFDGDLISLAELYFHTVCDVVEKTGADLIGHFDLISKFNEGDKLFSSQDPRYVRAWQQAADRLLDTGKPFEINTGAMARGYRTTPYPASDMIDYIRSRGGRLILSGDSHSAKTLCYAFDRFAALCQE